MRVMALLFGHTAQTVQIPFAEQCAPNRRQNVARKHVSVTGRTEDICQPFQFLTDPLVLFVWQHSFY